MNKYRIPAIVLGMTVNGLGVVRSLARNGVKVYAFDSYADRPGMATGYAKRIICPDVQKSPEGFSNFLIDFTKKIGNEAVLLPTSDAHNEFINNNRAVLEPYLKFAMPPKAVMDQLLDKKGQYLLARKFNVPLPETYFPQSIEEVKKLSDKLTYPVILKGLTTSSWRKRFGDKKAVIVKNAQELLEAYQSIHTIDRIEPIIQEIILGEDNRHYKICAYMSKTSNPLLTFTLQKIRQYPCDFGIGSSVISVREPEVARIGLNFMRDIGYYGVGSIEFKKDTRDEKFKMIEINPRLWAQNSLPTACGQNFALTAYLDILGEKIEPKTEFVEGIKWIAFDEDRTSFKGYHSQGRLSWAEWLKSIATGKRIWGTWAFDDPMPFFKTIKFGFLPFLKVFSKVKEKLKPKTSVSNNSQKNSDSISLHIIDTLDTFMKLREEWNSLLEKSKINNPFLRHEWLCAWWQGYGGDKELFIICFQKEGKNIGFAPLMKYTTKRTRIPIEAIGFISNHWTRMDFILSEDRKACLGKLIDLLLATNKVLIFAQIGFDSENFSNLKEILENKQLQFCLTPKENASLSFKSSWDDYIKNQSRNFRMDFNRKLKRLGKLGSITLEQTHGEDNHILKQLRLVAQQSWQSKDNVNIITQKEGENFYAQILKDWQGRDILDFSFLLLNDTPISYMVGLKDKGDYYAFDTAYNKEYSQYSPGMIMHTLLLEKLVAAGTKRFDFGYTAHYKKRWTEEISIITDITIFPKSIVGMLLGLINRIKTHFLRK